MFLLATVERKNCNLGMGSNVQSWYSYGFVLGSGTAVTRPQNTPPHEICEKFLRSCLNPREQLHDYFASPAPHHAGFVGLAGKLICSSVNPSIVIADYNVGNSNKAAAALPRSSKARRGGASRRRNS
jgi:hypothetical protein